MSAHPFGRRNDFDAVRRDMRRHMLRSMAPLARRRGYRFGWAGWLVLCAPLIGAAIGAASLHFGWLP